MDSKLDTAAAHRRFAVDLNNLAWSLLENGVDELTDPHTLVDMAHASAYHWRQVGTELTALRAQVLLTTVYVHLEWSTTAARHADRTHAMLLGMPDLTTPFDRAIALAAISRANELVGRDEDAARHWLEAQDEAAKLDPEDVGILATLYALTP